MTVSPTFWLYLAVMAGTTYLIRMIPLQLLRKKMKNRFVLSFLYYVPYAVLSAMIVPAVFYETGSVISATVGFLVAAAVAFFGKSPFSSFYKAAFCSFRLFFACIYAAVFRHLRVFTSLLIWFNKRSMNIIARQIYNVNVNIVIFSILSHFYHQGKNP